MITGKSAEPMNIEGAFVPIDAGIQKLFKLQVVHITLKHPVLYNKSGIQMMDIATAKCTRNPTMSLDSLSFCVQTLFVL